jgi:SAM-dependent methyltransferase
MDATPVLTPDRIVEIASGFQASKLLFAAVEAELFSALAQGPATLIELAERTDRPSRTIRILADGMVALGLLEHDGGGYRNAAVADVYLSGKTPADLRPALRFWNRLSYERWRYLDECVVSGRPAGGEFALTPEEQTIFSEGIEAFTAGAAHALAATYDFARHRRILDLGGGTGSFLRAILGRHLNLSGTLFEQPSVTAVARQRRAELGDRLTVVEGDLLTDDIPRDHDVVLMANVVHYFAPEANIALLRRLRAHAAPEARLLLVDFWMDATHTEPVAAALMSGEFLVNTGDGVSYSVDEARDWLARSGWHALTHIPLAGPQSLIVAERALASAAD